MINNNNADKINRIFGGENTVPQPLPVANKEDLIAEYEGQLAIDAYQTEEAYIIKAPIAGVKDEDLDVSITDNIITIKGTRKEEAEIKRENYLAQECYWGSFSRSFQIPDGADTEKTTAVMKNGILALKIPKAARSQTKTIQIKADE